MEIELRLEHDWILASIYKANEETVSFRSHMGQEVRPITKKRARALAVALQSQARKNPDLFYGAWFPTLWTGAGFWNGINDRQLRRSKRTHGYSELQVRTSRMVATETGHKIPDGWGPAEKFLINEWRGNLTMGNTHINGLWLFYDKDGLKAMNAYAAGLAGSERGTWVVTERQKKIQSQCIGFQEVLGALSRRESK